MKSLAMTTAAELETRLHEQILEVATLRLAIDLQSMRIAHMQPELLALPRRRQSPRTSEASAVLSRHGPPLGLELHLFPR